MEIVFEYSKISARTFTREFSKIGSVNNKNHHRGPLITLFLYMLCTGTPYILSDACYGFSSPFDPLLLLFSLQFPQSPRHSRTASESHKSPFL